MTRSWWLSLLPLAIPVILVAASTDPDKNEVKLLRSPKAVSTSNANVRQCLWFAMEEYNKESGDKYIFLVAHTRQAQLQVNRPLWIAGPWPTMDRESGHVRTHQQTESPALMGGMSLHAVAIRARGQRLCRDIGGFARYFARTDTVTPPVMPTY
ncbi:Cystatin-8 [Tupaia chinensis]|uniref:Cystatin-8 n=1 Tax=Tupaia chinensis TaxID=246437 RepID=L8YD45_TUPCH|nr:Cystatin-8 [Tupaia chinensis]